MVSFGMVKFAAIGNGIFLQLVVRDQRDGHHRSGHRDFVGAHGRFRKSLERNRAVVPFHVIANHRRGILRAVRPIHLAEALGGIAEISEDDVDRHAVAKRVVNRHGGVLQADRAVHADEQRLAFDLGVAVAHGDGGLFVAAGDEFGHLVAAVIDQRFVEAAETCCRDSRRDIRNSRS